MKIKNEKEKKKLLLDSNKERNYHFITNRWKMKIRTWCIACISHRIQMKWKRNNFLVCFVLFAEFVM